ncbi:BCL2/adenovirus E1B 19 kDa protein-interacting protein 2 [Ceratitis capitata]|uniref:BCL2/adenovirus E1B 19 kDa protein-interacting protein 2 n=1 Tax=Ceratitis capitata TaxID=7213 RepID=UPI000329A1D5|nr:BCL2/adenovirus E1B 19 kDa protein-interacting protein 2 [Ceratitis capitata]
MSLQMESPLTDSKMDISDATTSQGSAGVSPLGEDDDPDAPQSPTHNNHNIQQILIKDTTVVTNNTMKAENVKKENEVVPNLDNRLVRPGALQLDLGPQQRQNIERTITESHPLMSPADSENEHSSANSITTNNDVKRNNFPDVVPQYEHKQSPLQPITITERNTLNNIRGIVNVPTIAHNKLSYLRAHSPDLLSSESEADLSQYHATVESNFQSVSLIPTAGNDMPKHVRRNRKTIAKGANGGDDISSLDSISNHSFDDDEDIEHKLASLSPSSSLIDGLDDDSDDDEDGGVVGCMDDEDEYPEAATPTPHLLSTLTSNPDGTTDQLPQYSAAEERRDSRNWQKITLPDGRTREIDMRVIEPYKRVLSHGGYLQAGGHNAIVIFCACHLPDRSRADYSYVMDNLFLYVIKTLEQLVTEDYVLIYLHGGTSRRNVPPFPWLKKCYQLLDRRLRKSLKNMYLVHPTFWIKSIVWMTRPFVSAKFWRKLVYVKSLDELAKHVVVEKAAIPEKVKQYDARHN